MKKQILFLPLIVVLLWSCGKKGPLVLEPQKLPQAVEKLELRQVGREVELSWTYPARLSDGKTPLLPPQVRSVTIYHLAKPFAPDTFPKRSELLAKPMAAELGSRPDGTTTYAVSFADKLLQDKEHAFAVAYTLGRTRSALSAVQKFTTRMPPQEIRDLKISREGKVVVLSWTRPQVDSVNRPLPALAGYRIYRRVVPAVPAGTPAAAPPPAAKVRGAAFEIVNAKTVRGEYYEDSDTGVDGDYEYRVSSLLDERIESAPSTIVKTAIQDSFAPDVPVNLVAFSAKDHVFLTWEAVRDRDLDHYVVYRRLDSEEDFKVLEASVGENFFRDRQAVRGKPYVYAVAAVDRKGNESEASQSAPIKFE